MTVQQFDLFGNPVIIPITKEEKAKIQPASKQEQAPKEIMPKSLPLFGELDEAGNIIVLAEPENIVSETEAPKPAEEEVVYSDNQIRVKIKAKVEEEEQVSYKKRGRKPNPNPKEKVEKISTTPGNKRGPKPGPRRGRPKGQDVDADVELLNVPDEETLNKRLYWGIAEVAQMFGVNNSLIRYWANEFEMIQPRTSRKGDRHFRVEDIKNLQIIYNLLKVRKFSIEGAKKYLEGNKKKIDVNVEVSDSLLKIKGFLTELKLNLGI